MDISRSVNRSVDATSNVAQEMIEAQRRFYEALTEGFVESQKRGVRFAHSSAERFADSFSGSFDSGKKNGRSGSQFFAAAYDPVKVGQQSAEFVKSQVSAGTDYVREQAEANQHLYGEFEKSAREQAESLRKIGEQWMGLFRESAADAQSQVEEGVKSFQRAADQGLHAVANGHESTNGHSATSFPISGYEGLAVNDVSQRLRGLSRQDLQKVRAFETENKNRSSLVNELDRRIKSAS